MLPRIHLKNEIRPDHLAVTCINLLKFDPVQLAKHAWMWFLQLYIEHYDNQNTQNLEINQVVIKMKIKDYPTRC